MTASPRVVVHRDAALLAAATAARLVTAVVDAQTVRGHAHVVITGGGLGIATLAALASSKARDAIDWPSVDIWWGDERFLPAGDPDRNATQAHRTLLDSVGVEAARVHEMPAAGDADGATPDAAAAAYAAALAAVLPVFDVLLLGVGPDGHVASLFPGHPATDERDRTVVGVHESPKPPPARVSLTLPTINSARQVWLLAAGAGKAPAVGRAFAQALDTPVSAPGAIPFAIPGDVPLPASRVRGREATVWLLDQEAATAVPAQLIRPTPR